MTLSTTALSTNVRRVLFASGFMLLGSLGSVGLTAAARGGQPGGPRAHFQASFQAAGPTRAVLAAMERLDLDEDQQALLDEAIDELRDQARTARQGIERPDRDALITDIGSGSLDRAALHARVDARIASMSTLAHLSIDRIMDVYDSLTPDQKAELADMLEEAAQRRAARGGMGRQRGPMGGGPMGGGPMGGFQPGDAE